MTIAEHGVLIQENAQAVILDISLIREVVNLFQIITHQTGQKLQLKIQTVRNPAQMVSV